MAKESIKVSINSKTGGAGFLNFISKNAMAVAAVLVVIMLVIPLPKFLIDVLMTLNLALSIIILLAVIYTTRASNFSSFPQIILFATLFGLGINISSTRLILSADGSAGLNSLKSNQSAMVQAFANIVAGDNPVIGFIIFIILIIVQVIVITKGASRVSEVAARFTLDAMSTKQFDIDNQLNSGYITEDEARRMKAELRRDIDFYSNMDGSSKFVSGNVKAGIFITVINLVGGFIVGMVQNNLSFSDSLELYSKLTIGDGLLSQLPSLMLSFATGVLVTKDKSEETLGEQVVKNFTTDGTIYQIVGAVLVIIGIIFHNSTILFLLPIGAVFVWYGFRLSRNLHAQTESKAKKEAEEKAASESRSKSSAENDSVAPLDDLSLELGYALLPLVNEEAGAELLERISRIRRESALDIGLPVPKIRIIDNMNLNPNEYSFKIRGIEVGRSTIRLGYYMCMDTGSVTEEIKGEATKDPTFGMAAIWVPESQRSEAEQAGYIVVDPPTIIATHLTELIRLHSYEILGRKEVALLVNKVKESNPIVVQEVMEGSTPMSFGDIEKVLKELLREQVSIRDMVSILETLANYRNITNNTWDLVQKVREALGLQICLQYADEDRKLRVVNLSQEWQEKIDEFKQMPADGSRPFVAFDPVTGRQWIKNISDEIAAVQNIGYQPVLLCVSFVRIFVKSALEREIPGLVVISDREVIAGGSAIQLEVLGTVNYEEGNY